MEKKRLLACIAGIVVGALVCIFLAHKYCKPAQAPAAIPAIEAPAVVAPSGPVAAPAVPEAPKSEPKAEKKK